MFSHVFLGLDHDLPSDAGLLARTGDGGAPCPCKVSRQRGVSRVELYFLLQWRSKKLRYLPYIIEGR